MEVLDFSNLKTLIHKGNTALFVGAGCSILSPSCLPDFFTLRNFIINTLMDCKGVIISPNLRNKINDDISNYNAKPELLFQTISRYIDISQINLMRCMAEIEYNVNHKYIAKLCKEGLKLVITTNCDTCIEKALRSEDVDFIQFYGVPSSDLEVEK
jgi:hypothetical protein